MANEFYEGENKFMTKDALPCSPGLPYGILTNYSLPASGNRRMQSQLGGFLRYGGLQGLPDWYT